MSTTLWASALPDLPWIWSVVVHPVSDSASRHIKVRLKDDFLIAVLSTDRGLPRCIHYRHLSECATSVPRSTVTHLHPRTGIIDSESSETRQIPSLSYTRYRDPLSKFQRDASSMASELLTCQASGYTTSRCSVVHSVETLYCLLGVVRNSYPPYSTVIQRRKCGGNTNDCALRW